VLLSISDGVQRSHHILKSRPGKVVSVMAGILVGLGPFRDCRLGSRRWKICDAESGVAGDFPGFDFRLRAGLRDILYTDGIPRARLVTYRFRIFDDVIEVESLDGVRRSRYCSK